MSPLLRALTFSRAAHGPVTQAMLLQSYCALDAFRRGHGSRDLFMQLGRHLLVAEELCRLGYASDALPCIEAAHEAMVTLDAGELAHRGWDLREDQYARLRAALAVFDTQLAAASLDAIAHAEARMVAGLLRASSAIAPAEASA
jgi:hypothetical protein